MEPDEGPTAGIIEQGAASVEGVAPLQRPQQRKRYYDGKIKSSDGRCNPQT